MASFRFRTFVETPFLQIHELDTFRVMGYLFDDHVLC